MITSMPSILASTIGPAPALRRLELVTDPTGAAPGDDAGVWGMLTGPVALALVAGVVIALVGAGLVWMILRRRAMMTAGRARGAAGEGEDATRIGTAWGFWRRSLRLTDAEADLWERLAIIAKIPPGALMLCDDAIRSAAERLATTDPAARAAMRQMLTRYGLTLPEPTPAKVATKATRPAVKKTPGR